MKTTDMKDRALMSNFLTTGSSASSGRFTVRTRLATSRAASARLMSGSNSMKTKEMPSREVLSRRLTPWTWLMASSRGFDTRVSMSSGPARCRRSLRTRRNLDLREEGYTHALMPERPRSTKRMTMTSVSTGRRMEMLIRFMDYFPPELPVLSLFSASGPCPGFLSVPLEMTRRAPS